MPCGASLFDVFCYCNKCIISFHDVLIHLLIKFFRDRIAEVLIFVVLILVAWPTDKEFLAAFHYGYVVADEIIPDFHHYLCLLVALSISSMIIPSFVMDVLTIHYHNILHITFTTIFVT